MNAYILKFNSKIPISINNLIIKFIDDVRDGWRRAPQPYFALGILGSVLLLWFILAIYYNETKQITDTHKDEETSPETFVVLELFSEALESAAGGVGVKVAELTPKIEHVSVMYQHGEKNKAFAKTLGIATEVILLGLFVETFGIAEMFISALSFQDNWLILLAQSMLGVMISTKVALFIGEKVEEAAEHQYEHAKH